MGNSNNAGAIVGNNNQGKVISCYADGISNVKLVGTNNVSTEHCVEVGKSNYDTLVYEVEDLEASDGSVWKAAEIWEMTASGIPLINADYTGELVAPVE